MSECNIGCKLYNVIKELLNLSGWSIKVAVLIILSPVILFWYCVKGSASLIKRILGMDEDDEIDYDLPLPEDNDPKQPLWSIYRFIRKFVLTVFKMVVVAILSPVIMLYYFLNWFFSQAYGSDNEDEDEDKNLVGKLISLIV